MASLWHCLGSRISCAATLLLLMAAPAGAQPLAPDSTFDAARRPRPSGFPVAPGIWRLHGIDPALATDDLEPLRRMIGKATVVGLGETWHTSGGFYVLKHRVFRFLVEKMGFRAFAVESSWVGADLAAQYVQTCEGTAQAAIRQHINVWQGTEFADLVQWMCEWNRAHPAPADKLHFFGFDVQQPREDAAGLTAYLARVGIPEDHSWVAGIRACDTVTVRHPYGGVPQATHDQCLGALAAIEDHFQRHRAALEQQTSKTDLGIARLHLVGLRAWENQVFLIAHDFAAGFSERDEGMAYAFLAQRGLRVPTVKTVVWAANAHVARTRLPNGSRPMGLHLANALGRDYVSFAVAAHVTEIDFPTFGCGPVEVSPGAVEERFHALGHDALLVDLAFPGTRKPFLRRGTYMMGIDRVEPHKSFHGLLWLERSDKMHPLVWPPC